MSEQEQAPSKPGEVRRHTAVVTLPALQNGETIRVRIRSLPPLEIMSIMEGLPGVAVPEEAPAGATLAESRARLEASQRQVERLVSAAVIEPRFYFGEPEADAAAWSDLLIDNQAALAREILDLSGWKAAATPERAAFREGGAGQ